MGTYNLRPLILMQDNPCPDLSGDGLRLQDVADTVAGAAVGNEGPFTIGVFGPWGTGKTSLLNLAREMVDDLEQEATVTVWFNAWQHEREPEPLFALIAAIIQAIRDNKSRFETAKDGVMARLMAAAVALANGIKVSGEVGIPEVAKGGVEIEFEKILSKFKEMMEGSNEVLPHELAYADAFSRLTEASSEGYFKVVVFIDDLDRCDPEKAVHLLESIKLILNQRGFVFVLALADNVVTKYLQHVYTDRFKLDPGRQWGESYLEKIVNLPVRVPPHRGTFVEYARSQVVKLAARHRLLARFGPVSRKRPGKGDLQTIEAEVRSELFERTPLGPSGDMGVIESNAGEFAPEVFTLASIVEPLASGANYNPRQFVRLANSYLVKARLWQSQLGGEEFARPDALILATDAILEAALREDEMMRLVDDQELCRTLGGLLASKKPLAFGGTSKAISAELLQDLGLTSIPDFVRDPEDEDSKQRCELLGRAFHCLTGRGFEALAEALRANPDDNWFVSEDKRGWVRRISISQNEAEIGLNLSAHVKNAVRESLRMGQDEAVTQAHCDEVQGLDFYVQDLSTMDLSAIAKHFPNLKYLEIAFIAIGDEGLKVLSSSPRLANLRGLSLFDAGISSNGVSYFAESPYIKQLENLSLGSNPIGREGAMALATSQNSASLRELYLYGCGLDEEGVRAIVDSPFLTNLKALDISNNDLPPETFKYVKSKLRK